MVEEVTFAAAGFLRLSRRLICHSRMHLLHQIVQVTTLSTDVIAKNKSNSSIMIVFDRDFFARRKGKNGCHCPSFTCVLDRVFDLTVLFLSDIFGLW